MLLKTEVKPHRFVLCQCLDAKNINKGQAQNKQNKTIYVNIHVPLDDHFILLYTSLKHTKIQSQIRYLILQVLRGSDFDEVNYFEMPLKSITSFKIPVSQNLFQN